MILKKGRQKGLIGWKPFNSKIMTIRQTGRHINMKVIQCYGPNYDRDKKVEGLFFNKLQAKIDGMPHYNPRTVMRTWMQRSEMSIQDTNYNRAMGREGWGTRNDIRERLLEFCTTNHLIIEVNLFPQSNIHKLTWCSPSGRGRNQINSTWWWSLLEIRVRRGADCRCLLSVITT